MNQPRKQQLFMTGVTASVIPVDLDDGKSIWQIIKDNPRVISYAVIANSGSILFGYDILVTGACVALPAFSISYGELYNGQLILPAKWQSLWTAFVQFGIMLGAFSNGFIQDKFGRRVAYILGGVITAIGTVLAYTSADVASLDGRRLAFFFAKLIIGIGMGMLMSACQTYVSEVAPPRLRGALLGFFAFVVGVGQMIAVTLVFTRIAIINTSAFKIPFAVQWGFSGLAIITAFILPESPTYLITKNKRSAAEKAYIRLHGSKADVAAGLNIIQSTIDHERAIAASAETATYADCFKGTNARRTWIIILITTMQHFLGVSLLSNANYFLIMAGMSPTKSLQVSQIGTGLQIACTYISWFTMSSLGRRFLTLASTAGVGIVFVTMGVAGFYQHDTKALTYVGASILLVGSITALGLGSVWPVVANEVSSSRLRAKSSGIGFLVNAFGGGVFTIAVPYLFNADAANLGAKIGFVFAGFCLLGFTLVWFVLPETKSKTYEELDYLFEIKAKTRAFKKPIERFDVDLKE
ncbi:general substrate transporter [Leptodontidium sp. MPI-SDFR-AT-0119]|nr:general substrate transporter [Leptodontidium sp. MPI-SDFR-AT-0119]